MKKNLIILAAAIIIVALFHPSMVLAQDTLPFWSLAGNSNVQSNSKLGTTNNRSLRIYTNNIQRMIINSIPAEGYIGINTTVPTEKLHLVGNQVIDGTLKFTTPKNALNAMINMFPAGNLNGDRMVIAHSPQHQDYGLQYRDTSDEFDFLSNGTSVLYVGLGSRNVGIGTASPLSKFHVVGNQTLNGTLQFTNPAAGTRPMINMFTSGTANTTRMVLAHSPAFPNRGLRYRDDIDQFDFLGTGGSVMAVNLANGRIGLGAPAPTERLHVAGNIRMEGEGALFTFNNGQFFQDHPGPALQIETHGDLTPDNDGVHSLGTDSLTWFDVWATDLSINTSDARLKENVQNLSYGLLEIMKLRPVTYDWINIKDGEKRIGLIAQEVQRVIPEMVKDHRTMKDEVTGKITKIPTSKLGLQYDVLIPIMTKAIQEQQADIEAKDQKITNLQSQLDQLKELLVKKGLVNLNELNNPGNSLIMARLEQSIPNPSGGATMLRYFLPGDVKKAAIQITSINGATVKFYPISNNGPGQLIINTKELAAGEYIYTLIVNGNKSDSKRMIVTR